MSDVPLSMKLSWKSLSAPVVHADKAGFTEIGLKKESAAKRGEHFIFFCLERCLRRPEPGSFPQEEQKR